MAKILVTGASGFVGNSLVPALISAGHDLRCAVSQTLDWLNCEQVLIDRLESQPDWSDALKGVDIVIHLAARVHIMKENSDSAPQIYNQVNTLATKKLAEQAAQLGVKRFVFLSSIKVNGEFTQRGYSFTEECTEQPDDPYAQSKLDAEKYLLSISQKTGMEVVILRPPLIFGPGVKANFLKMLQLVNKSWPLPFAKVENKRSFVFIDNLVSAIGAVAVEPEAANQVYLVADDEPWSLPDLLNFLAHEMDVKSRLFALPGLSLLFKLPVLNRLNKRLLGSLEVSNSKLKSQLGWIPPVTSAEGLSRTVNWYKNECNS